MKFLILAAFVAVSSAAGLRDTPENLQAWYDFGDDKRQCIVDAASASADDLEKAANEIIAVMRKHPAFTDIVDEVEYIRDTFVDMIEQFEAECKDINILKLAKKVMESVPVFAKISGKTVALYARVQLLPVQMGTPETATMIGELGAPFERFASSVGKLGDKIVDCLKM